jgi:hypothetical protein
MPVSSVERPVSALRQRMLEDMAMRGLRSHTQHDYIRFVRSFAAFLGRSLSNSRHFASPYSRVSADPLARSRTARRSAGLLSRASSVTRWT